MRCLTILFLCLIVLPATSQKPDHARSITDHYFYTQKIQKMKFIQHSSGLLATDTTRAYGFAEFKYANVSGDFRRSQEAQKSQYNGLYTEGFNKLGRFTVQGQFEFRRTIEDSLANSLKGMREDLLPYYYFVQKPGEFERQDYRLKAIGNYELLQSRLFLGLGIDYMSHVSSRSVDPRPRVAQFGIKLKPEITYSANNQQITIGGFWGKGDEDNSVIYKNRNYGLSLTFPERIYYINQGYGFIVMKDTANLRRYDRFSGINTSYSLSKDRYYVGAYAQLLRQSQDNTHEMRFRNNYYSRTNFELSTYKAGLLLSKENMQHRHQLEVELELNEGDDFNNSFKASNYRVSSHLINVQYLNQRKKLDAMEFEFGLMARYAASRKEDFSTDHLLDQSYVEFGPIVSMYRRQVNRESFVVRLKPLYRLPLFIDHSAPSSQETVFTRAVLYPDYNYYSSHAAGISAQAQLFSVRFFKNFGAGLSLNSTYMKQLQNDAILLGNSDQISGRQFVNWINLNLYL